MSKQIKDITATFENGDVLVLSLKESTFAGYKPAVLWELFYGEKINDAIEQHDKGSIGSCFNTHQTEYFPASMYDTAKAAFNKRLTCSNPMHESDTGFSLERMLEKLKK